MLLEKSSSGSGRDSGRSDCLILFRCHLILWLIICGVTGEGGGGSRGGKKAKWEAAGLARLYE